MGLISGVFSISYETLLNQNGVSTIKKNGVSIFPQKMNGFSNKF
jgi:hypothetical protein